MPRGRRSGPAPRPAARSSTPPRSSYSTQAQAQRPAAPMPPPPMPRQAPPPPAHAPSGGGMLSGLGGMVAQGMALGTGSALAHRAVDAVFSSGSRSSPAEVQAAAQEVAARPEEPCSVQAKYLADCLSYNNGDMGVCQQYFDAMQQCRLAGAPQQAFQ